MSIRVRLWRGMVTCALFALAAAGCDDEGTAAVLDRVEISPAQVALEVGERQIFVATAHYSDGDSEVVTQVEWESSDETVITIAVDGTATALAAGSATIRARYENLYSESVSVTVEAPRLLTLQLAPGAVDLRVGEAARLFALGTYDDGSSADLSDEVVWTTSNGAVATVVAGLVTAEDEGMADIQASVEVGGTEIRSNLVSVTVTTPRLMAIQLDPSSAELYAASGDTVQLAATGIYDDGTRASVGAMATWTSSDPDVATVSGAGRVSARGVAGTVGITATVGAVASAPATIVVRPSIVVVRVTVEPDEVELPAGLTEELVATAHFQDGHTEDATREVLWESSDPRFVLVDQAGKVRGVARGEATVRASLDGKAGVSEISVVNPVVVAIGVEPAVAAFPVGVSQPFAATGRYSDGGEADITQLVRWSSSNRDVVTIDQDGVATALDIGMADVVATLDSLDATAHVQALAPQLVELEIRPAQPDPLPKGRSIQFAAWGRYTDGADVDLTRSASLTWTSSRPAVASVSNAAGSQGHTTALEVGGAQITARYDDGMVEIQSPAVLLGVVAPELETLVIDPSAPEAPIGETVALELTGTFSDGHAEALALAADWESSNPGVATVNDRGEVSARAEGQARVTASYAGVEAEVLFRARPATLLELEIAPPTATLPAGIFQDFTVSGRYSDGRTEDVGDDAVWESSAPGVATVDGTGRAVGVSAGRAEIRATLEGRTVRAELTVTQARLTRIEISPAAPEPLPVGRSIAFTATGIYTDGAAVDVTQDPELVWSSSEPTVATIDSAGDVLALGEGITRIGAALGDVQAFPVVLPVTEAMLVEISVEPASVRLAPGFDVQFEAFGRFSDGRRLSITDEVSWSSANPGIARVSGDPNEPGLVTAVAPGRVAVSAELDGSRATAEITVSGATLVSISVTPPSFDLEIGTTRAFAARGNFDDGSTLDLTRRVTWSIDPASLGRGVSVSNSSGREGLVTVSPAAVPGGALVRLYATLGNVAGVAELTLVRARTLLGIVVSIDPQTVPVGLTAQARATGLYSDGVHPPEAVDITNQVTWSPVVGGVASVSNAAGQKGLATGLRAGSAMINACLGAVCADDSGRPGTTVLLRVTACELATLRVLPDSASGRRLPRGLARQYRAVAYYDLERDGCGDLGTAIYDLTSRASWSSSDARVATVSRGYVRAAASPPHNDVQIRAVYDGLEGVLSLTVVDACVETIALDPPALSMPVGVRQPFTATAHLSDGTNIDYTDLALWQTTGGLANLGDGLVQSFSGSNGAVRATALAVDGICASVQAQAAVEINDARLTSIAVTPRNPEVVVGGEVRLTAMGVYSYGPRWNLTDIATWSSSNTAVASVMPGGRVEGIAAGHAVVLATVGRVSGTADIHVGGRVLERIEVFVHPSTDCGDFGGAGFPSGVAFYLGAHGYYSDGSAGDVSDAVSWRSLDLPVARVNAMGLVRTVAEGVADLEASIGAIHGELEIRVVDSTLEGIEIRPGSGWTLPVNAGGRFFARGVYSAIDGGVPLPTARCDITGDVTWDAFPGASMDIGEHTGVAVTYADPSVSARVTATLGGVVAESEGSVVGACVRGVSIRPAYAGTTVGLDKQFFADAVLSDGSTFDVTAETMTEWFSDNPAVAVVIEGRAIPVGAGQVEVSVRYDAGEAACPDVGPVFEDVAELDVDPAALTRVTVTCPRANDAWPAGEGQVRGVPAGVEIRCFAQGSYTDGQVRDITRMATWRSSNGGAASVEDLPQAAKGRVFAIAEGATQISAALDGVAGAFDLRIVGATLRSMRVDGPSSLAAGFTARFTVQGLYRLGETARFYELTELASWSSSSPENASVGDAANRGLVSAHLGTIRPLVISASYRGVTGQRSLTVLDVRLVRIDVQPAVAELALGESRSFSARGIYVDDGERPYEKDITATVRWTTSDPAVASVSAGRVTARTLGDVAITAESGAASGSAAVAVVDRCIDELRINHPWGELPAGVPIRFTVTGIYSNGAVADLTADVDFQTSDPARMAAPTADGWSRTEAGAPAGRVLITATTPSGRCAGFTPGEAELFVNAAVLEDIVVSAETDAVPIGLTAPFHAVGYYSNDSNFDITRTIDLWVTGSPAVAIVANAPGHWGEVRGVGLGATPVVATQGAISGHGEITVTGAVVVALRPEGFDSEDDCRTLGETNSWGASPWRHPAGGFTTFVRAVGLYSDGSEHLLGDVSWLSSRPERAQVVGEQGGVGRVRTALHGGVVFTAVHGDLREEIAFESVEKPLHRLDINPAGPDPVRLALGNQARLDVLGQFDGLAFCVTRDAAYLSEDPGVAAVDASGTVRANGIGDVVVSAAIGPVDDLVRIRVGDPELERVEVQPDEVLLYVGETAQLRLMAYYSDGTVNDVTYNTGTTWAIFGDGGVIALNAAKGLVRAVGVGDADVGGCTDGVCAPPDYRARVQVDVP